MAQAITEPMGILRPRKSRLNRILDRIRSRSDPRPGHPRADDQCARDPRPPLIPVSLPLLDAGRTQNLALQGWSTVSFPQQAPDAHPLQTGFEQLFEASKAFFDLPTEYKRQFKTRLGSEDGWNCIPGEKEFITIRTLESTPVELKDAAEKTWKEAGLLLDTALAGISKSLGMECDENEGLRKYVGPCKKVGTRMGEETATMLRLFRYEGDEEGIVAEPHRDLGLLSLVIGNTPGLEVWDIPRRSWFPIEKTYSFPTASLLVGRQLERLSNGRYRAGGHQVRSYGTPASRMSAEISPLQSPVEQPRNYRYSIVFVLRAHEPIIVDTDELTTSITGPFQTPIKDTTAGQLYENIRNAHFNINTNIKDRDEQRQRLAEGKTITGGKI